MMKKLLLIILFLFAAVWAGLRIQQDPGYVLISYDLWTIEMPLWFLMISLLTCFFVLFSVSYLLKKIFFFPETVKMFYHRIQKRKHAKQTIDGFIQLAEGNFQKAERKLLEGAKYNKSALLNYLGAAMAAQELHAPEKRDDYLRLAYDSSQPKDTETAIGLTQAKLQLEHGQLEQCCATLQRLQQLIPNHEYILKLLAKVYIGLKDWDALLKHTTLLKTKKILDEERINILYQKAVLGLAEKLKENNAPLLAWKNTWQKLPKHFQYDTCFLFPYLTRLITEQSHEEEAEVLIKTALKKQWHANLINCYGDIQSLNPRKQLSYAEHWLRTQPNNPLLLLALGKICKRQALWGKAVEYLKHSLKNKATPEAYLELGSVYVTQGEMDSAHECFYQGLVLAVGKL